MSRPVEANHVRAAEALRQLLEHPIVAALAALPQHFEATVVGGAVRDQLLGRPPRDIDAVVAGSGAEAAAELGARLGARPFRLGGDRFAAFRIDLPAARLDLWDRAPMSLEQDLERRDLTINAIAFRLRDRRLLDPFDGVGDLARQRLRAITEDSFGDDPLRVVRLARFAAQMPTFEPEAATVDLARRAAPAIEAVASERVREEIKAALTAEAPARALALLGATGAFERLWRPSESSTPAPVPRMTRFTELARDLDARLGRSAVDRWVGGLATIFDELPNGGTHLRSFHERGLISNRELRAVERLLAWRRLPEATEDHRWFLHRLGDLWSAAACHLGSASPAVEWAERAAALVELATTRADEIFAPPPLLDGHQISESLALPPGPRLGDLAGRLRREQIEGRVTTREAALAWLRAQA